MNKEVSTRDKMSRTKMIISWFKNKFCKKEVIALDPQEKPSIEIPAKPDEAERRRREHLKPLQKLLEKKMKLACVEGIRQASSKPMSEAEKEHYTDTHNLIDTAINNSIEDPIPKKKIIRKSPRRRFKRETNENGSR